MERMGVIIKLAEAASKFKKPPTPPTAGGGMGIVLPFSRKGEGEKKQQPPLRMAA